MLSVPRDVGEVIVEFVEDRDVASLQRVCKRMRVFTERRMGSIRLSLPNRREVLRWMQTQYERHQCFETVWYRPVKSEKYVDKMVDLVYENTPLLTLVTLNRTEDGRIPSWNTLDNVSMYYLSERGRLTTKNMCSMLNECDGYENGYVEKALDSVLPKNSIANPETLLMVLRRRRSCVAAYSDYGLDLVEKLVREMMESMIQQFGDVDEHGTFVVKDFIAVTGIADERLALQTYKKRRDELRMLIMWLINMDHGIIEEEGYVFEDIEIDGVPEDEMDNDEEDLAKTHTQVELDVTSLVTIWEEFLQEEPSKKVCVYFYKRIIEYEEKEWLPCNESIIRWLEERE